MCLLSAFLLLCLACLEIPEMSALNDDVSNDFTFLRTDSNSSIAVVEARAAGTKNESSPKLPPAPPVSHSTFKPISNPAPRDLLALHSLWRT